MNSLDWKLVCKVCIITYTKNKPERHFVALQGLFFICRQTDYKLFFAFMSVLS